jgi:hypothetical protein
MRFVVPPAAALVAVLLASRGADASPSARLVYARDASAASCPDEETLRKAVAVRFGYDPFFHWAKKTVVVLVWRDHGVYSARVEIVDSEGIARGSRAISSDDASCEELFDAAALAISIALDASIDPSAPEPSPTASPTPSPPSASPATAPPPPPSAPPPPLLLAEGRPAAHRAVPVALGVDGLSISSGLAPRLAFGAAAFSEVFAGEALSVALELFGNRSLDAWASPPGASVTTSLFGLNVVPCLRWGPLRACGVVELGWLQASADLRLGRSDGTFIAASGARLGAEWRFGGGLFVRAHADGLVVLNQVELDVDYRPFWQASRLAGTLALGAGYRFP